MNKKFNHLKKFRWRLTVFLSINLINNSKHSQTVNINLKAGTADCLLHHFQVKHLKNIFPNAKLLNN